MLLTALQSSGYDLPAVNLGLSSFLDGGPLRPTSGFYWQQFVQFYYANKLVDSTGKSLVGLHNPHFNYLAVIPQAIYQFEPEILFTGARLGVVAGIPFLLHLHINHNQAGILSSGAGCGDLFAGIYLQWDPVMYHGRPLLIHRLEFAVSFPTGKDKEPKKLINPGNGFFFIDPYWAGTLFFTTKWAISWRVHYLWCAKHRKTDIQAGSTIHLNYSTEYEILSKLWVGINGYFLQQLRNSKLNGIAIPNSKERVVALGVGALYTSDPDFNFVMITNMYLEFDVRNRPKGLNLVLNMLKHF